MNGEKKLFPSRETVRLSPLPFLEDDTPGQQRAFYLDLIKSIEDDASQSRHETGRPPMGTKAILSEHPHAMPEHFGRSPAPAFHASSREDFLELRNRRIERQIVYKRAAEKLRRGEGDVQFPDDCFPPRLPFVKKKPPT